MVIDIPEAAVTTALFLLMAGTAACRSSAVSWASRLLLRCGRDDPGSFGRLQAFNAHWGPGCGHHSPPCSLETGWLYALYYTVSIIELELSLGSRKPSRNGGTRLITRLLNCGIPPGTHRSK